MKEKFLPIGTVILMKDATKRLMITGYCSSTPENSEKVYDYVGCLFPEGNLAGDEVALFNHDQIGNILHMGLDDQEFVDLNHQLHTALYGEGANPSVSSNDGGSQNVEEDPFGAPTPFGSEVIQREKIDMGVSSVNDNVNNEEKIMSDLFTIGSDNTSASTDLDLPLEESGSPVLQLEPIFGDGMGEVSSSVGGIKEDVSAPLDLPFALPVVDNSNM